ncbi:hypothetical protein FPOAC2_13993 [Fusarium poae]|uniref:Uncharacterized protein n=1 Tax=Fusarium poae TaxID=36050 RepID=A0A1B8A5R9_FUSPO|nr:hypothetical protein FPOA_13756 [Fusarium poae]OBS15814.1 hypothetical protein FPOA_13422 [Fusarium poae]
MPPTCESLLEQITYNLKISSDTFNTVFPGVSTSRRFLESVRNLSLECGNWDTIQHLLQTARKHRHENRISTVSRTKQWVPWDAQEAEKMWDKNPSTATKNTAIECATGQKVHVIFCGVSRYSDLGTAPSEFISIPVYPFYSAYEGKLLQYFTREYLENLEHDLGRGLVAKVTPAMEGREGSHDDGEYFLVHQIVLAMIAAKESGLVSMELRSPKWVSDMVATHELPGHVADISADKVVIFAPWESDNLNGDVIERFYMQTQEATAFHENLQIYPTREESHAAGLKLIDIAVLDRIARDAATPSEFSYRPRTCLGRGKCTMADWPKKMVLKRNFSCGSRDVRFVSARNKASWNVLACTGRKHESSRTRRGEKTTWFHQEYVESLGEWGEIRVMMIGGEIIIYSRTQWIKDKKAQKKILHVRRFISDVDLEWHSKDGERRKEKYQELEGFCKFIYRAIISSPEAERYFESLYAGLRLDIGISDDGRFFVNELTRWYEADLFSMQLSGSDRTAITERFGENFAKTISNK